METLQIKKAKFHFTRPNGFIEIVGCGGNGSWFVPPFLKMIAPHLDASLKVSLWDPDVVEARNVTRQNFVAQDVGKNKAEVLAERYGLAYGASDCVSSVSTKYKARRNTCCIIGFVDDLASRVYMSRISIGFFQVGCSAYIDVGNEGRAGQAYVQIIGDRSGKSTPRLTDVFPGIKESEHESCVDQPQNIFINTMSANVALQLTREFLIERSLDTILTFYGTNRSMRSLTHVEVLKMMAIKRKREK